MDPESVLLVNDNSECPGRGSRTPAVRARRAAAPPPSPEAEALPAGSDEL